jgi:hypothetical protein
VKDGIKTSLPFSTSYLEFLVLIPEGLVALVIGGKGKQINTFMQQSGAEIVVNQPVYGMSQRSVSLKGSPRSIATAVSSIYETLEKLAYTVGDFDKRAVSLRDFNIFRNLFRRIKSSHSASL